MTRVGVVGLGIMGRRIATTLANAGMSVTAFDVSQDAMDRARDAELLLEPSLADLAAKSDVVLLSLPTPAVVLDVVGQIQSTGHPVVVLDTSTIDPDTARACRDILVAVGMDYADCPILGRPDAVGQWTVPVGGSVDAAATATEVLAPLARAVLPVGEVGAASTIKVLNNLMLGTINAITAEVLLLAEAAGVDPGVFVDVVIDSGAASVSGLFTDAAARAVGGDFTPTFSLRLMHKDNRLALAMAESYGIPLIVGSAAQTLNTMALASGHGDEDSIAVLKALEVLTGLQARRHAKSPEHKRTRRGESGFSDPAP